MLSILNGTTSILILILLYTEVCQMDKFRVKENLNLEGKELEMVHLLFRHGIRTPFSTYPRDPYKNETFYPYGRGQLTGEGKKDLYKMGKWLKRRYGDFLGTHYQPDLLWAESTGSPRTIMSLQTVLAGMYSPKYTAMNWDAYLDWQPIPTFAPLPNNDTLLLVYPCPRFSEVLQNVLNTWHYQKLVDDSFRLFEELTFLTEYNVNGPFALIPIYWILRSEYDYGLQLTKQIEKFFPHDIASHLLQGYTYYAYNEEQKRMKGGPFVKSLIQDWTQKRNGSITPKGRKIFAYCGHDLTVVGVLSALNLWKDQMPEYGVMLMFELYRDVYTGEYSVQIYLRENEKSGAVPLTMPGCDRLCPLDRFIELTKNVIPEDLKSLCQAKKEFKLTDQTVIALDESLQSMMNFFPKR